MQRTIFLLLSVFLVTQLFNHAWRTRSQSSRLLKRGDPLVNFAEKQVQLSTPRGSVIARSQRIDKFHSQCDNIWEHEDQCAYVLENCSDTIPSLINYLQWYYCSGSLKPLILICLVSRS